MFQSQESAGESTMNHGITKKPEWNNELAEGAIAKLLEVLAHGFPPCYEDFQAFLFDFYPSLHWTQPELEKDVRYMLAHKDWDHIQECIQLTFGFDLATDLLTAITSLSLSISIHCYSHHRE